MMRYRPNGRRVFFGVIIVITGMMSFRTQISNAADIVLNCGIAACTIVPSDTLLFSETNMIPGNSVSRRVELKNNRSDDCSAELAVSQAYHSAEGLSGVIHTSISDTNTEYFQGSLEELFANSVSLGTVRSGELGIYDWDILLPLNTGNEYQSLELTFDIAVHVTCAPDEPMPTPMVLAAAIGPEHLDSGKIESDYEPRGAVLGLADTGVSRNGILFILAGLAILAAIIADIRTRRLIRE